MRLTVVIPSYQRRVPLRRLLRALGEQLAAAPDCEVVVVLDGSTDGSREMLRTLDYPVPLRVLWQPNAGLAAARNAGLAAAAGDAVWFLDDDLEPAEGTLERHLAEHRSGEPHALMGPSVIPAGAPTVPFIRDWYESQYTALAARGRVEAFDTFSAANTSAPAALWRDVGAFSEAFVGYGMEDYEIGYRLLRAGTTIRFDAAAMAWHHQERGIRELCARKVAEGRNLVRMVQAHPESFDLVFPGREPTWATRLLDARGWRRARTFRVAGWLTAWAAAVESRRSAGTRDTWFTIAVLTNTVAGVAELDSEGRCVDRLLARG